MSDGQRRLLLAFVALPLALGCAFIFVLGINQLTSTDTRGLGVWTTCTGLVCAGGLTWMLARLSSRLAATPSMAGDSLLPGSPPRQQLATRPGRLIVAVLLGVVLAVVVVFLVVVGIVQMSLGGGPAGGALVLGGTIVYLLGMLALTRFVRPKPPPVA